jgi:hypothetical protein
VAFEKHRIRLWMAAGAWRNYHEFIHARLCPSSTPAPPTPLSKRTCGALTNSKLQERAARNLPRPVLRLRCARGGAAAGTATQGIKKKKKKSQGRAKNMGRKTEDRVSPNRKTAKK